MEKLLSDWTGLMQIQGEFTSAEAAESSLLAA